MNKRYSYIGLVVSIVLHLGIVWFVVFSFSHKTVADSLEDSTQLSMEMMSAILNQEQVATAPDIQQNVEEKVEAETPLPVSVPNSEPINKEKPKHKPKKEKAKEKTKAVQVAPEVKKGVIEKNKEQSPAAVENQAGKVDSTQNGTNQKQQSAGGEVDVYRKAVIKAIQKRANNSYPARERMLRKMGNVIIQFSVSSYGEIINVKIKQSSGNDNFDRVAVNAAKSTKINQPPPQGFPSLLELNVKFTIVN